MDIVGFDFGTTNSLVSIIRGGRPINFFDDQGLPIPSTVCYEGSHAIVGRDAKERMGTAGLGVYGNIVRSPKILVGQESVFVDGVERSVVDVVADVIKEVKRMALASRGRELKGLEAAVVTIPVNFEGYRRAAIRDAFRAADVRVVQFIHEPFAALYGFMRSADDYANFIRQYDRQIILVFDWGGGTLDLTLCRLESGALLQIANDGTDDVGGDMFDESLRREVLRAVRHERGLAETVSHHPDAMVRLLHQCERAKIDLSTRDSVEIYVDHFFRGVADDALNCRVARTTLEAVTHELVSAGIARIHSLLDAANVSPAQVAMCLATGGMANVPVIKARLHELFGAQRVHAHARGGASMAEGAAWVAHDRASLQLAKSVELALARNSYLPLVKAGTRMPSEGEVAGDKFHLYCVDPRDGSAKFQIVSPRRPGTRVLPNDQRAPLTTMTLSVDTNARPFRERLELQVRIDDNLILHADAVALLSKGASDRVEVHNLEFGIEMPEQGSPVSESDESVGSIERTSPVEKGTVTVRANVADSVDSSLVPGELQYELEPNYFDTRRKPPQIQVEERLYYAPCAKCGRLSNDPACRCGSAYR
ncbi:MAG TPA: Hsp70 family protein [Phycisphaerales bacterium]|nr:Hsp70 family protein [Phycisphaerales bacterium]